MASGAIIFIHTLSNYWFYSFSLLPQVINNKGYNGAKADLWSCGVILFVLMAGYLPFEESNLMALYKKVFFSFFPIGLFCRLSFFPIWLFAKLSYFILLDL